MAWFRTTIVWSLFGYGQNNVSFCVKPTMASLIVCDRTYQVQDLERFVVTDSFVSDRFDGAPDSLLGVCLVFLPTLFQKVFVQGVQKKAQELTRVFLSALQSWWLCGRRRTQIKTPWVSLYSFTNLMMASNLVSFILASCMTGVYNPTNPTHPTRHSSYSSLPLRPSIFL